MPPSAVTLRLAERVAAFRHQDLPPELVAHAKLYLLDTLGAMLVASAPKYPGSRIIMRFVKELGGVAESSLVGQGEKTSCVNAALANGTLGYYCDVEPHHVGAILHGLAVMVPTSLAVGEKQGADGKRFLAAMILGVEVATRVSYAFDPVALYNRGFHPSAICGAFGAAAAAGYLFRLGPERQAVALGLAMQQACGLLAWANDPTEHSRPFNPGLAARNGTTAAYLAHLGFGGPPTPFEGKYDAFTAFSGSANPNALLDDWGKRFHLPEFAYKLYSSCSFTHPGLDALLGLAADEKLSASDIDRIVLRFPKNGAHMIDNNPLKSHCAQYILPVGLLVMVTLMVLGISAPAAAQSYNATVGGLGGVWYTLFSGLSELVKEKDPSIVIRVVPGGGLSAVQKVGDGTSEFGFGFPWTMADARAGREPFKAALPELRAVMGGFGDAYLQVLVDKRLGA